jgi:toxin ParE1/3/4
VSYRVILRTDAEADVASAYAWYEERSSGLGAEFMRAVDACMASVGRGPEFYQLVHRGARRALLRRFPYALFFFVVGGTLVEVVACLHTRRDPRQWLERVM